MPCISKKLRRVLRSVAESATVSAMISAAPCRASSTVFTPFSGSTNGLASSLGERVSFSCAKMDCASGSSPSSRAIEARVRRFGLKGRYKSSASAKVAALAMDCANASSSLPWLSIELRISSLRFSSPRRYSSRSESSRKSWSSKEPVISLRYRAINGMVFPWSIRSIVF